MRLHQVTFIAVLLLLLVATRTIEAKRRKHKNNDGDSRKTKTKTKWSSSTDTEAGSANTMIATEEHGYYVKRTYVPENATLANHLRSPPYLAIPIAWFSCPGEACQKGNSGTINGNTNAQQEGFLCDDDCAESYAPICGRTPSEVAVFYNKCKLNVAKCRTHGLWTDYTYAECQQNYPKETEYTDKKFRASPYFRENQTSDQHMPVNQDETKLPTASKRKAADNSQSVVERDLTTEDHLAVAMAALDEINAKLDEADSSTSRHDDAQDNKDRLKYDVGN